MIEIYNNYDVKPYLEKAKDLLFGDGIENPTEDELYDCAYNEMEDDWRIVTDMFLPQYLENNKYIAVGSVGRWDGNFGGWTILENMHDFYDLIDGCRYIEIKDDDGHLFIRCTHHDGTNSYELKELTYKGYNFYNYHSWNYDNKTLGKYLFNNNFNSRLPHLGEAFENFCF